MLSKWYEVRFVTCDRIEHIHKFARVKDALRYAMRRSDIYPICSIYSCNKYGASFYLDTLWDNFEV